ncbi:MAG: rhodanese-like domain-containing protein [Rhodothermales bacterium]
MNRLASRLVILALIVVSGCTEDRTHAQTATTASDRIAPAQFLEQVKADDVVIDVRTPAEFSSGHLVDAQNINVQSSDFRSKVESLDRDKTYYLYCRSGNRSGQAQRIMQQMGFKSVINIGGIADLSRAGAETVR